MQQALYDSLNWAKLAYEEENTLYDKCPGAIFFDGSKWGRQDTQFYAFATSQELIIVFRGSSSLSDFKTDVNIWHEDVPKEICPKSDSKVHHGFLLQFMAALPALHTVLLSTKRSLPVRVIGHSLGGALATLCALSLKCGLLKDFVHSRKVSCVTFGSPRVGNTAFADVFDHHVDMSLRAVNGNDAVTMRPYFGYKHVKGEFKIGQRNDWIDYWKKYIGSIDDHYLSSYTKGIMEIK